MDKKQIQLIDSENKYLTNIVLQDKYYHQNEKSLNDIKARFEEKLNEVKFETIFKQSRPILDILFDTFIPAGSILYGFGSTKNVSLSNCYYVPIESDSIDAIGKTIAENMKVFSWRGGVGNSFEILRPKDAPVNNAASTSTGSVSFMPLMSNATKTIGQNGRRGASIFTHAIWHPDIVDFIKSKAHPEEVFEKDSLNNTLPKITGANISVKLTDTFMSAYENNSDWDLVFPELKDKNYPNWNGDIKAYKGKTKVYNTIKAKELMRLISQNAWDYAEPGVLFWDNILNNTPMTVIPEFTPKGVNPCGEQILPDYGSCNLGAIALHKYVDNPYAPQASFNFERFISDIYPIVEFMDLVIDVNKHPLEKQSLIDNLGRKIGLGITGLADCLAMLNLDYGSEKSIEMTEKIMATKAYFETIASIELAKARGACPILKPIIKNYQDAFVHHKYFKHINDVAKLLNIAVVDDLSKEIATHGMRNIGLSTIAPTGSISIVMDNCTSGVEPLFAFEYYRKSNLTEGQVKIIHPTLFNYLKENNPKDLDLPKEELVKKYHYVESHSLNYKKRIDMQAVCQMYVTDSISSTVNLSNETTVEEIEYLYVYAYKKGLKGITIYRDGCNLGGILTTSKNENTDTAEKQKVALANKEKSTRYRVKWKNSIKTYITVTQDENGEPLEVFTKVPKEAGLEKDNFNPALYLERQSYWDSLCRLISLSLRFKIPLNEIIKQLDKSSYSMYDLAAILKRALIDGVKDKKSTKSLNNTIKCPECGEKSYIKENGCGVCLSCGYSKCD